MYVIFLQIFSLRVKPADTDILDQNTAGLGLIHESQSIYNATDYTRPWFAWANSYFSEYVYFFFPFATSWRGLVADVCVNLDRMILDLADRKPHLILKDGQSYKPEDSLSSWIATPDVYLIIYFKNLVHV